MVTRRLHGLLYEKRILNGETIVVVFEKEGVKGARGNIQTRLSILFEKLKLLMGSITVEQRLVARSKANLRCGKFSAKNYFNKHYQNTKGKDAMARNKEFDDVLDELKMLHDAKNHDYATQENPYKNLEKVFRNRNRAVERYRDSGLMDKFSRLEEYCVKGELAIKSEGDYRHVQRHRQLFHTSYDFIS